MTFKSLSFLPRRPVVGRSDRAESGAAAILLLMMSLVFVPIALAHAATLYKGSLADVGPQQIAGLVNLLLLGTTGTN